MDVRQRRRAAAVTDNARRVAHAHNSGGLGCGGGADRRVRLRQHVDDRAEPNADDNILLLVDATVSDGRLILGLKPISRVGPDD